MNVWEIEVDGKLNKVIFTPDQWFGRHKLTVNGKQIVIKKSPFQAFVGIDQPILIADKECRFVFIGHKADIVVDGSYIDSKKQYVPLNKTPWWIGIFVVTCVAIPIVSHGGALPVVIALLASIWCFRVSVLPNLKLTIKVLICFGIAILSWGLLGVLVFAMSGI